MSRSSTEFHAAVTGLGLVTPAGVGVEHAWRTVLAAEPAAAADPALEGMRVDFSCRVPGFDADEQLGRRTAWRLDRSTQLAIVALREALHDSGLDPSVWDGARVAVVLGNALGGVQTYELQQREFDSAGAGAVSPLLVPMCAPNMTAGHLAMECGAGGPNLVTATACASGTTAIGTARELLRSDRCDVVITGGTEAPLGRTMIAGFDRMGALSRRTENPRAASRPFDVDRDGFVAAEGAAVLVLERDTDARARGARVHGMISGYGASADAHHATAPDPSGAAVERAVRSALQDAGLSAADIDHVNAHGTSTKVNDVTESRAIRRVFDDHVAVTSTKGVMGHALGAAGAIEAVCSVLALRDGVVPPTANLDSLDPEVEVDVVAKAPRSGTFRAAVSNSFGFGGQNAVLVVTPA
ncbi:beta-ketoacyl-[acyl-carrier-protein] synthase family protein [Lentzea sp. DG1S-22]|uniref:beta-ketoacyl-[acyl-carrier-protein] synthase family protein n=1 Tax=Lentzea sp. DG1S-22 TaxID=3108822 RepID=UPI002E75C6B6|nr:beta-ketoacyl-[acyl-carrier-protein] synthase family protein [Lentzea sp. DG1S-22]WVH83447.1 beta-ketoacyl-[acyl-carrier-protein] synthase family protein [Lentzea sp. DG1S-22]